MENKNLIFINNDLDYTRYSVESAHSTNVNHWKNWYCSIGMRTLYIDFDGNVFKGVCREGGWLGNVNNVTGLEFSKKPFLGKECWVKCTRNVCFCGADMAVPKVKNKELIDSHFENDSKFKSKLGNFQSTVDPTIITSDAHNQFKMVIWDLGRRCNFDCWYCSPNSHNNFEAHKNYKMLEGAFNNLNECWIFDQRTKFVFTGGEPTVYKDYLQFVKMLKSHDHIIHTTTNGSNTPEYYSELSNHSDVVFSIHLNYVKQFGIDKFLKNIQASIDTTNRGIEEDTVSKYNWVVVRIMFDPGNLDIAKETHNAIKERFQGNANFVLAVDMVHQTQTDYTLFEYSEEEKNWFNSIND
jgi:organic radical activating enzyme